MIFIIAFFSLILLVTLHEFGHFITAKYFGVKVEEFGIGYPPRIIGKKIGQTLYSLNLLPFGAFVKMPGEDEYTDDPNGFSKKPIWQRSLIVVAGVLSFWVIAAILFTAVMGIGAPTAISDDETAGISNPVVQIVGVAKESPAEQEGLKIGDNIMGVILPSGIFQNITKVKDVQEINSTYSGQELSFQIERGKEVFTVNIFLRENPPAGEGSLGISLVRVAIMQYPWWQLPWRGIVVTFNLTIAVLLGYYQAISNIFGGHPSGVELTGPVGIVSLFGQASKLGLNYFLQFMGMIAVYVAIFNILPIPALDGGKLLFLGIEAVRKKPLSQKVEQIVTTAFFGLLILLMVFVTIKDVIKLF